MIFTKKCLYSPNKGDLYLLARNTHPPFAKVEQQMKLFKPHGLTSAGETETGG